MNTVKKFNKLYIETRIKRRYNIEQWSGKKKKDQLVTDLNTQLLERELLKKLEKERERSFKNQVFKAQKFENEKIERETTKHQDEVKRHFVSLSKQMQTSRFTPEMTTDERQLNSRILTTLSRLKASPESFSDLKITPF